MSTSGKTSTAFVMAGGGSLGAVEVGMLKELLKWGEAPAFVVGASAGAINGAFFAAEPTLTGIAKLEQIWCGLRRQDVFPFGLGSLLGLVGRRGHLIESNNRLTIQPGNAWSVSLGHRYLDDAYFGAVGSGHDTIFSSVYYRLNENWGARMTQHYEARDHVMEEQYYTLYRDLRSWTSALTFRVRDNRTGPKDYTIAVMFSLKAIPRHKLGSDSDYPVYLLGR